MAGSSHSIGQVLTLLRNDFPDVSISKIRFLESEGLVSPERAPSGYRRYHEADVERLRYILSVQKNHYLPLKVIREHLDLMDRGMVPPKIESPPNTPEEAANKSAPAPPQPAAQRPASARKPPLRMSRSELMQASGLTEPALIELEREMIVVPRRGTNYYGREAVTIAIAARRLAEFGIDARHLRQVKSLANREYGIIEQAIAPHQRRAAGDKQVAQDVTQLVIHVHAAMMKISADR